MNDSFQDPMALPGRPPAGPRWIPAAVVLFTAALALVAFLRIHTYLTGQDPRTFIVLARRIAEARFSLAAIREVARFVVPGYPLLLAPVVSLFGVQAAFWTNLALFTATLALLNRLFARLMEDEWQAGAMTLFCLAGLFAGFHRNAHFLLLAFRQTPIYLFMAAAMLALLRASTRATPRRFVPEAAAAGGLVLLGAAIRETGIFMVLPLALFALARRPRPGTPGRGALAGSFLLPVFAAGAAAAAVLAFDAGALLNTQSRHFLSMLPALLDFSGAAGSFRETTGFLVDELRWGGLLLAGAGLWCARRRPAFLFFFLLPAVLFFFFDGAIKAHRRFFLTTLFLLLPLAALALAEALAGIHRLLQRIRRIPPAAVYLPAFLALAAWGVAAVRPLAPWGVRVSAAEINRMADLLARAAPGESSLLIDGRTRYLADALTVFTRYEPLDAADPDLPLVRTPPRIFIEPLNKEALHHLDRAVAGRDAIAARGRLERTGVRFALGTGEYEIGRVLPWEQTRISQPLPDPPARPAVLRLVAPRLWDSDPPRTFVRAFVGGILAADRLEPGANYLLADPPAAGPPELVIESDAPVPADFQPEWRRLDAPLHMDFGELAFPSFESCLSPDFFEFAPTKRDARDLKSSGTVRLPLSYPSNTYLIAMAGASTVHDDPSVTVTLGFSAGGQTLAAATMPAAPRLQPVIAHLGPVGDRPLGQLRLDFTRDRPYRRDPPNASGWNFRLHNLILYPALLGQPWRLDLGARGDAPYAVEGFHAREGAGADSGRWTSDRARLFLPLQPGRAHRLEIRHRPMRPAAAPPAAPRLLFNGQPLDVQADDDRLAARIPAGWVTAPSNSLEIFAVPWRPSDFSDSPDARALGLFLQEIHTTPAEP